MNTFRTSPRPTARRLLAGVAVAALVAASCGGDDDAPSGAAEPADEGAGDPGATTVPAEGDDFDEDGGRSGDLVVGYVGTVDNLIPFPQGARTLFFRLAVYDPFISIDEAGEPVPMLAESWELADDATSLTLQLRDGVTFHDGTPFDADVAVDNIEMFKDPETNVQGGNVWAEVTATAVDDNTVEMTFDRPLPEIFAVMDTALVTKPGELDSGIGTGPFVVDSLTARQGLKLSANADYWDRERPKVATLELREFADAAAAALVAQAGELHILVGPQPNAVEQLERSGMRVEPALSGQGYDILVNAELVPDPLVRQALSMAFDRERFVDTNLLGFGSPMSSIYPPSSPVWADQDADVAAFDLDGARALLDEAGVDELDLTIMSPTVLPLDQFMPLYQADLASIGVNLTIEPTDPAAWGAAVAQPGAIPDLAAHAYAFADLDPALIFSAHPFRVGSNASGYLNDEYEELVAAASLVVDRDERIEAFREVDAFIAGEAFMFPVANPQTLSGVADGVEGYQVPRSGFDYSNVTVSD